MYSRLIVEQRLDLAAKKLGFRPEYHSPAEVDDFAARLERRHQDAYAAARAAAQAGDSSRASKVHQTTLLKLLAGASPRLNADETRWMQNERALVMCDAEYFLTRYYQILNTENVAQRFSFAPRPAQRIAFNCFAALEEMGVAIEILLAKARQLGMTTLVEGLMLLKILFASSVNAVAASADESKTREMVRKILTAYDKLPWWLRPVYTRRVESNQGFMYFGDGGITFQHGEQTTPIAMGSTVIAYHLSEISSYSNAGQMIDVGLHKAVHPSPRVFGVLESTCKGNSGWWHDTYWNSKKNWKDGACRMMALFLPFYTAIGMYPNPTERLGHPVPRSWRPIDETHRMVRESEEYVTSNDVLAKVLMADGKPWKMARDQAWYWEWNFLAAREKGAEKDWYAEMPHCVAGGTRVSTERGIIPIKLAAECRECESGKIGGWKAQGNGAVLRIGTRDGRELVATAEHLIQTTGGWKEVSILAPGDQVVLCPPRFADREFVAKWQWLPLCDMQVSITPEIARLLGYFMGDGSFWGGIFEVAVDEKDEDVRQDVRRLIRLATGKEATEKKQGKMWRVQSSNQKWLEVLKALDCVEPAFHKSLGRSCGYKRKVQVPDCIWRSPKHVVREFLSALYECDGHAYKAAARARLFSCHDSLLRDVQLLLLGFGINSNFSKLSVKHTDGHEYTGRNLEIPAAFANPFYDQIGFIGSRKQNSGKRRDASRTWGLRSAELLDTVVSVESCGAEEVFDLGVVGTHQFSANGILVHNSDRVAFQSSYDNVFGKEIIAEINSARASQDDYDTFGIIGQSVESRHEPDPSEMLRDSAGKLLPRIPIKFTSRRGTSYSWEAIPLEWREQFETLEDLREDDSHMGKLFVYEHPKPGYDYSIGVRTSVGIGSDPTAVAVCRRGRTEQEPDVQAAEFRDLNVSHVEAYAWVMAIAAYYGKFMTPEFGMPRYHEPYVAIEQVQSVGDTCQLQMRKMGYSRFHRMTRYDSSPDKMRKKDAHKQGWYSFGWAAPLLNDGFVTYVLNGWYKVNSPYTLWEMDHWEIHTTGSDGKVKFEAAEDSTSYGLSANALAAFCPNDLRPMAHRTLKRFMDTAGKERKPELDISPTLRGATIPLHAIPDNEFTRRIARLTGDR